MGFVYETAGLETTYILRLDVNLDIIANGLGTQFITTLGGVSTECDIQGIVYNN